MEQEGHKITVEWYDKDGNTKYFKRRKIFGTWWDFGYEFYWDYFDSSKGIFHRLRRDGYTFDVLPFKDRSIVSIRPRKKLK
jgi:hypothetical protein